MAEIRRDDILDPQVAVGFEELAKVMGKTADEIDVLIKKGIELSKVQKDIASSQKSVATASEEVNKNAKETEAQTAKLNTIFQKNYDINKELEKQRNKEYADKQKAAKQQKENEALINKEAKSLQELAAQNKALTAERNKLDLTTDEGKKMLAEYNKRIEENSKNIIENGTAQEKQRANIGNYRNSLEGLFVQFKNGEMGLMSFGKQFAKLTLQMLANPIVLIIAAIVGAFVLLYKAFKSTDSGGTEIEARFKQISAIVSVLMQRVADLAIGLFELFKGNFSAAAEKFEAAVTGVGDQLKNATKAAYDYVYAMDALQEAEDAYISKRAENENKIAKLEYSAQDRTKSTAERKKALEEAIKIKEEEVKKNKEFAETKYREELKFKAAEYNISVAYLEKLIKADDEGQKKMIANDKRLAAVRDKLNDDGQKNLEELYAKTIEADTKFFEENKRNMSKLSGFEEEINKEREERAQKFRENRAKEQEQLNQLELARLNNLKDGIDKEIALLKNSFESQKAGYIKDVSNKKIRDELIKQAEIKLNNEIAKITDAANKEKEDKDKENSQKVSDAYVARIENLNDVFERSIQNQINLEKERYLNGEISAETYNNKLIELNKKLAGYQLETLKTLLDNERITEEAKLEIKDKIQEAESKLLDDAIKQKEDASKKEIELTKKVEDEKQKIREAGLSAIAESFNFVDTLYNRQLSNLETQKAAELALVGDNETAKAEIEKKYATESANIKRKQAIADKAQALFNIAIGTAEAIVKALPNPILAAIVATVGALQAATVIATPLPQFDKGVDNAPAGGFIAGEKRPEIMRHKGKYSLISEPTIFGDSFAGAKIIGGAETDRILRDGVLSGLSLNNYQAGKSDEAVQLSAILSELKSNKEKVDVHFDSRGIQTIYQKQRFKNLRIDKYIS